MGKTVLKIVKDGIPTERECLSCKSIKPFSEFQKDAGGFMQKKARCKECCNTLQREVEYPKNKRSGLRNRLDKVIKMYGVSYGYVVRTLDSQLGLCANRGCGKEISLGAPSGAANRAVIDHCHETGNFRAVLCSVCNLLLGKIENDRNQVYGLLEYITKHTTKENK